MSCSVCPDTYEFCVNEGSSRKYRVTLLDDADQPIPSANVAAIVCTLKDYNTGEVINNRDAQGVKDQNGGTYHAMSGLFTMTFDGALDAVIKTAAIRTEKHLATFLATFVGGGQYQWDVVVKVKNLGRTAV